MSWLSVFSMSPLLLLAVGLPLNAAASCAALWRGSVDAGGAVMGALVGTLIFTAGGPVFWLILAVFFLSSTGFSRFGWKEKAALESIHQKGGRRDLFQVAANGGVAAIMAVLFRCTGDPAWAVGFAVAFASSNADTWASEVGVLSRNDPVSILTFRPVPRGVSGGVSLIGSTASVGGALLIALAFAAGTLSFPRFPWGFARLIAFVTVLGSFGSLVDSLLGATVQARLSTR